MSVWRRLLRLGVARDSGAYHPSIDSHFINRELSWLDFNERVLTLATDAGIPLLERLRFVSIFSSNLDEFFQIRVAALKDQIEGEVSTPTPDGRTPAQQLSEVGELVGRMIEEKESILLDQLLPLLEEHGVQIRAMSQLTERDRTELRQLFELRVFPVLTPLAVDPAHPFPYISNLALSLALQVRDPESGERRFARVKMPPNLPRFVAVGESNTFVLLEDLIGAHIGGLFPGMEIEEVHLFRVTRNADLAVDDEDAEDLLAAVEMELRRRRFGKAVRLEIHGLMPEEMLNLLLEELELSASDVYRHRSFIDTSSLSQLSALDLPELKFRPWKRVVAGRLSAAEEEGRNFFDVIRERQLLVHHPNESFSSSVEAFVEQAAKDPKVQSIKMTLYRTSGDSSIARHLIKAAEAGKQVAAVLELKARFDEARNVSWAKELEYAGVHVTYGLVGLKTHAKCVLVVRQDEDCVRRYVHIGTGNYNSVTARVYEDVGYFTCEEEIGADATDLFNFLTGYAREPQYRSLIVAPRQLRPRIIELIDREASFGVDGRIVMKLNSISDPDVIEALYRASEAGAQIDLIIRGICCLRPGVEGMSSNIRVRSILGRHLEHSRLYRFEHGQESGEPLYIMGSADMMGRNLDGRVEVLVPLTHPKHRAWLDKVLSFLMADDVTRFELHADNRWKRQGDFSILGDAQERLHRWVLATQVR
jgi:polyphosphate kinase